MKRILWIIPALILVSFLGAPAAVLKDAATGLAPQGIDVAWPFARYALEPLAGFGEYVLSFSRYIFQLISWMAWLALLAGIAGAAARSPVSRIVKNIGVAWTAFLTFVVLVLILPLPAPKLVTGDNRSLADLHSHTWYSHDGVKSPAGSIDFHRRLGFDIFFASEHNHTRSFEHYPAPEKLRYVYPGTQMSTTQGISLLILADRPFDGALFKDLTVKELIDRAHKEGFVVICPHWWKWRKFTWRELAGLGLDGFEVYNAGYRKFPETERREMIDFCRENGLIITGSTDWHGWGRLSNVWTVLDVPKKALDPGSLSGYLRSRPRTQVVVYSRPEVQTTARYVFEPFFGAYYYFGSMDWKQTVGWAFWIFVFALAGRAGFFRRFGRFTAPVLSGVFLTMSIYYLAIWLPLRSENLIIPRLVVPVLLTISAGWFAIWRVQAHGKNIHQA